MNELHDIIRNNGMSTRPEYYSGRGATLSDLNSQILQGIYDGISKEFGEDADENYVKMVADIKVLSATTFLQELYNLERNGWKYTEKQKHADGIAIPKNKDGEYDEISTLHGLISVVGTMSNNRDDTGIIRGSFLASHGVHPIKRCEGYYGF
jgi:hypothetical protein